VLMKVSLFFLTINIKKKNIASHKKNNFTAL